MSKKKTKRLVPKRIAGVKVPKPVRQALENHLGSKDGRKLIGDAVVAAVAAVVAAQSRKGSVVRKLADEHAPDAKSAAREIKSQASDSVAGLANSGSALALALAEASRSFVDALQRHKAEADARTAWPPIPEGEAAKPKEGPAATH